MCSVHTKRLLCVVGGTFSHRADKEVWNGDVASLRDVDVTVAMPITKLKGISLQENISSTALLLDLTPSLEDSPHVGILLLWCYHANRLSWNPEMCS